MSFAVTATVGGSLIGGYMSSKASEKASKAQQDSAAAAQQLEWDMFQQQRDDQEPFRQTGVAANARLATLLGLNGTGSGSAQQFATDDLIDTSNGSFSPNSKLYAESPQYKAAYDKFRQLHKAQYGSDPNLAYGSDEGSAERSVASMFNLNDYNKKIGTKNEQGKDFGALTRKFSLSDLNADPVYKSGLQFGLNEGRTGINSRAIAGGGYDSGATLKALTRFANDYGSTKANESFNRFQTENTNLYNRLAGVSGAGQAATNQVGAASQNYANNASSLLTDSGNARAAGIVGSANAWNDAISSGVDIWGQTQRNNTMRDIYKGMNTPVTEKSRNFSGW